MVPERTIWRPFLARFSSPLFWMNIVVDSFQHWGFCLAFKQMLKILARVFPSGSTPLRCWNVRRSCPGAVFSHFANFALIFETVKLKESGGSGKAVPAVKTVGSYLPKSSVRKCSFSWAWSTLHWVEGLSSTSLATRCRLRLYRRCNFIRSLG